MFLAAVLTPLKAFWQIALFTLVIIISAWIFSRIVRYIITKVIKRRIQKQEVIIVRLV